MWKNVAMVVVICLLAGADSPKGDLKKLQGAWAMTAGENDGNKSSEEDLKSCSLAIEGNKYTVKFGGDTITGTLKLDPTKKPKMIDSTRSEGETLLGIYELNGDDFKVSLAASGK